MRQRKVRWVEGSSPNHNVAMHLTSVEVLQSRKNNSMIQSIAPTRYGTPVIPCQWWVPTTLKICWSYMGVRSEHTFQNPSLCSAAFRVWLCDAGSLAVLPLRCGYNMTRWDAAAGTVSLSTHQTKNQHGSPTLGDDVTWCPEIQVLSTAAKALATLPSTAREAALYYRHRFWSCAIAGSSKLQQN